MMDPMDVYTPHTLIVTFLITACIIISAVWNAAGMIRLKKNLLFAGYMGVQAVLLAWAVFKLLELTAPSSEILRLHVRLQQLCGFCLAGMLVIFFFLIIPARAGRKAILLLCPFFCGTIAFIFFLLNTTELLWDIAPIFCFAAVNIPVFLLRRSIFAELSPASIDQLMDKLEDPILIFNRSGELIDSNECAQITFDPEASQTLAGFIRYINGKILSGQALDSETMHSVIHLDLGAEERTYTFGRTLAENKSHAPVATVLTFLDITESTLLIKKLESKNEALGRLNLRLKNYIAAADRLEVEEEKNRAIFAIQQALGNSLSNVLSDLEKLKPETTEASGELPEKVDAITVKCRGILSEIRQVIEKLFSDEKGGELNDSDSTGG